MKIIVNAVQTHTNKCLQELNWLLMYGPILSHSISHMHIHSKLVSYLNTPTATHLPYLAVTGGSSIGKFSRLSQPS